MPFTHTQVYNCIELYCPTPVGGSDAEDYDKFMNCT